MSFPTLNKPITGYFFFSLPLFKKSFLLDHCLRRNHKFVPLVRDFIVFLFFFFTLFSFISFSNGYFSIPFPLGNHFPPDGYYPSEYAAIYEADACLCMILINRRVRTATFNLWIERLYAMRHVIGMSCGTSLIGRTIGRGKIEFSMWLGRWYTYASDVFIHFTFYFVINRES